MDYVIPPLIIFAFAKLIAGVRVFGFAKNRLGALAQLGEHLLCKQGVIGSIPIGSTKHSLRSHLLEPIVFIGGLPPANPNHGVADCRQGCC